MPSPFGKGPSIHRSAKSLNKLLASHIALAKAGKLPDASTAELGSTTMSIAKKAKQAFLGSQSHYEKRQHEVAKQPDTTEHSVRGPEKKVRGKLAGQHVMNFEAWWKFPSSRQGQNWTKGNKLYNGHLIINDVFDFIDSRGSDTFKKDS